jgi:hypothetical protein
MSRNHSARGPFVIRYSYADRIITNTKHFYELIISGRVRSISALDGVELSASRPAWRKSPLVV